MILIFTALFFKYDYKLVEETFLVEYFVMSIVFHKVYELLLKVRIFLLFSKYIVYSTHFDIFIYTHQSQRFKGVFHYGNKSLTVLNLVNVEVEP